MKSYETNVITATGLNTLLSLKYEKRHTLVKDFQLGKIELSNNRIDALALEVIAYKKAYDFIKNCTDKLKTLSYDDLLKGKPADPLENSKSVHLAFIDLIYKAEILRGNNDGVSEIYANSQFDDFHFTFLMKTDFEYHEAIIKKRFENKIGRKLFFKTNRERRKNALENKVKNIIELGYNVIYESGQLSDLSPDLSFQLIEESIFESIPNLPGFFKGS
ncbi:MAG: hypothetical protein WC867_05905 [Candidatus Pacearchaeota archaeon]|jgi:hypothetical protein